MVSNDNEEIKFVRETVAGKLLQTPPCILASESESLNATTTLSHMASLFSVCNWCQIVLAKGLVTSWHWGSAGNPIGVSLRKLIEAYSDNRRLAASPGLPELGY